MFYSEDYFEVWHSFLFKTFANLNSYVIALMKSADWVV